eukprot:CAMPEP_0183756982 /NCGR_PEP_ID=MMETSP0739-20130205/5421_1 /TAXON_ID=385413 /ORGANISM="Thalassiosira miniscula, Strain CCMP1093" /LENGTH=63 /DNA_ID=CAMNT_0025994309 /DNA_START=335 /DNA_END=528 /DNA_ORIENTATION=-
MASALADPSDSISRTLVATDIHANCFLKGINAQPVQKPEGHTKWGEDARSPAEDEKNCNELGA